MISPMSPCALETLYNISTSARRVACFDETVVGVAELRSRCDGQRTRLAVSPTALPSGSAGCLHRHETMQQLLGSRRIHPHRSRLRAVLDVCPCVSASCDDVHIIHEPRTWMVITCMRRYLGNCRRARFHAPSEKEDELRSRRRFRLSSAAERPGDSQLEYHSSVCKDPILGGCYLRLGRTAVSGKVVLERLLQKAKARRQEPINRLLFDFLRQEAAEDC